MSSRVNEVNGENLQDPPPIKNPRYANDSACAYSITLSSFTYYIFTMLHCLSVLDNVEGRGGTGPYLRGVYGFNPPRHVEKNFLAM